MATAEASSQELSKRGPIKSADYNWGDIGGAAVALGAFALGVAALPATAPAAVVFGAGVLTGAGIATLVYGGITDVQ